MCSGTSVESGGVEDGRGSGMYMCMYQYRHTNIHTLYVRLCYYL